jgi:hypothetical protein
MLEQLKPSSRLFITKKGYKCYDPKNKKLYISRDVIFQEDELYYGKGKNELDNQGPSLEFNLIPISEPNNNEEEITQIEHEIEMDNEHGDVEEESDATEGQEIEPLEELPLRRSTREIQASTRLRDFITYKVSYPIQDYISYENISTNYKTFLTTISKGVEPHYQEAMQDPKWCKVMQEELNALEKNKTWEIVQLPKEKKARRVQMSL